jgi:sugar phosphate permease
MSNSLVILYIGNLWYAVTKKSLSVATFSMKEDLGITAASIAQFSSSFSLTYGIFKLVGGLLTDIFPAGTLFSLGLLLGSIINLVIPFLPNLATIQLAWSLNGLVQGGGGPALSKIVIEKFAVDRRASIWSNLLTVCSFTQLTTHRIQYVLLSKMLFRPITSAICYLLIC